MNRVHPLIQIPAAAGVPRLCSLFVFLRDHGGEPHSSPPTSTPNSKPRTLMQTRCAQGLIIAILSLLLGTSAFAATVTWSGSGDGVSWHQGANWSGGIVPPASSDVTISVPASNPTILFTSSVGVVQINSLTTSELMTVSGGTLQVAATIQT